MRNRISSERIGMILAKARNDAGKSQEYVAKQMGVARRSIQNWEYGYATPDLARCIDYFDALGLQPLPYLLQLLYGEFDGISPKACDEKILNALIARIKACSPSELRKILFIMYGDHGSSTHAIIEMTVAHLHIPLKERLNICQHIILNYEIAKEHNTLVKSEHVLPDMEYLTQSFNKAKESVVNHKESYTNVKE